MLIIVFTIWTMLNLLICLLKFLNGEGSTIHFSSADVNKEIVWRKMRNINVRSLIPLKNQYTTRNPLLSGGSKTPIYRMDTIWKIKQKHCIWVDKCNFGITHFGIDQTLLSWNDICWDIFHLVKNVIILIMTVVYKMVYKIAGDYQVQNDVLRIMAMFWYKYSIDVWIKNRNFHSLNLNICDL